MNISDGVSLVGGKGVVIYNKGKGRNSDMWQKKAGGQRGKNRTDREQCKTMPPQYTSSALTVHTLLLTP